jgi:hypothetical protein
MARRPHGTSSRLRRTKGPRRPWATPSGKVIDLPVVVDIVHVEPTTARRVWSVEACVDLVEGLPTLVSVHVASTAGLRPDIMQERFRWATPLDIVLVTVPQLLELGIDPFTYSYPLDGFPNAAHIDRIVPARLTDDFLAEIVVRYLRLGRGYAKVIADERNVSPRTVVSWIEKARARGILSATTPGAVGGKLVSRPRADR